MIPKLQNVLLAAVFLQPISATAQTPDNTPISRADVPDIVLKAAHHHGPGLIFTEYGVEIEDDLQVYELGAEDPDGMYVEIDILADGTLQEIEWETPINALPVAVHMEFFEHVAGGQISFAERSIRPDGYIIYEIEGRDMDDGFVDVEIADTGRTLRLVSIIQSPAG